MPVSLTPAEFCREFNVSKTFLYDQIRKGLLTAVKVGRATRIARIEAERWFADLPEMGKQAA